MQHQCILEKVDFKKEVLCFFEPFIIGSPELACFEYSDGVKTLTVECYKAEGSRVPSTSGIWVAGAENPILVRNLYLFSSAIEAISFFHFYPVKLQHPEQLGIASLGLLPSYTQVAYLKNRYVNAKIHLVFAADLPGRVADCRVSLWIKQKEAKVSLLGESESFRVDFRDKTHTIEASQLSLFSFEKLLQLRSGLRTHKPPKNYNSFYGLFLSSI